MVSSGQITKCKIVYLFWRLRLFYALKCGYEQLRSKQQQYGEEHGWLRLDVWWPAQKKPRFRSSYYEDDLGSIAPP
jgi:hypothetical protein